jgi:LL-diaminopimelate aminotransferase
VEQTWLTERNGIYRERMDIVLEALANAGMEASRPRATLYAWPRVPPGWSSEAFALALLEQTGVAITPGPFFGSGGEGYVRISVTAPTPRLEEAMGRLRKFATSAAPSRR